MRLYLRSLGFVVLCDVRVSAVTKLSTALPSFFLLCPNYGPLADYFPYALKLLLCLHAASRFAPSHSDKGPLERCTAHCLGITALDQYHEGSEIHCPFC